MSWSSYLDGLSNLFDKGGYTLWAILAASGLLWILIVDRYWAHARQLPELRNFLQGQYLDQRSALSGAETYRRVQALVGDLRSEAMHNIGALNALTTILPLLGLLGTVSGMIKVFDVITVFGTGNTRGMAHGISAALVTTMAGLFTALSGLYFVSDLERRAEELARKFESELVQG